MHCLSQFCYMCLDHKNTLYDILDFDDDNISWLHKVKFSLESAVLADLPLSICKICSSEVKRLYNFKKMVLQNKEVIERYVKTLTSTNNYKTVKFYDLKVKIRDLKPYLSMVNYSSVIERKINNKLYNVSSMKETEPIFSRTRTKTKLIDNDINNESRGKKIRRYDDIEDDNYACSRCDKKFESLPTLRQHYISHVKRFKFTKNSDISNDIRNNDEIDVSNANSTENNEEFLNTSSKDEDDSFSMGTFSDDIDIEESTGDVEDELYACNKCFETFKEVSNLRKHYKLHENKNISSNRKNVLLVNKEKFTNSKEASTETNNSILHSILMSSTDTEDQSTFTKINENVNVNENFNNDVPLLQTNVDEPTTDVEDKPFACNQCCETFKTLANLRKHFKSHTKLSETISINNDTSTFTKIDENVNVNKNFNNDVPLLQIKPFTLLSNVDEPTTDVEDKPFACNQCCETFKTLANLRKHYKSHTELLETISISNDTSTFTKINENVTTNENFNNDVQTNPVALISNINEPTTDVEDKPFACNQCCETFKTLPNLRKHYKSHTKLSEITSISNDTSTFTNIDENTIINENFNNDIPVLQTNPVTLISNVNEPTTDMEDKPFACNQCCETFKTLANLRKHFKSHTILSETISISNDTSTLTKMAENVNEGQILDKNTDNIEKHNSTLISNLQEPTEDIETKPYACNQCYETFKNVTDLRKHYKTHKTNLQISENRNIVSDVSEQLQESGNSIHIDSGKETIECNVCGKTFDYKRHLEQHLIIHKGEKPYACETCGITFQWLTKLRAHCKKAHETTSRRKREENSDQHYYSCNQCDKKYIRSRHLKQHIVIQHKMFNCRICDFPFNSLEEVNEHLMTIHNITDPARSRSNSSSSTESSFRIVKCKFCTIILSSLEDLAAHMLIKHSQFQTEFDVDVNSKSSECCYCNATMNSLNELAEHLAQCDSVKKKFKKNLDIITCRLCSAVMISVNDLIGHMLAKHNISSLNEINVAQNCLRCNIRLNSISDLAEHMTNCCKVLVQPNNRFDNCDTIKCSVCNIVLISWNDLAEHMSMEHNVINTENNISLNCHICNITANSLNELSEHITVIHKDVLNNITILKCNLCNTYLCTTRDYIDHMLAKHNI